MSTAICEVCFFIRYEGVSDGRSAPRSTWFEVYLVRGLVSSRLFVFKFICFAAHLLCSPFALQPICFAAHLRSSPFAFKPICIQAHLPSRCLAFTLFSLEVVFTWNALFFTSRFAFTLLSTEAFVGGAWLGGGACGVECWFGLKRLCVDCDM